MRFISSKTHGVLDYLVGILLLVTPYVMGFYGSHIASNIFIIMGVTLILYSLLTRYEMGLVKVISFDLHLILDIVSGVVLASAPWLFHFSEFVSAPHVVFGLIEIAAALLTRRYVQA